MAHGSKLLLSYNPDAQRQERYMHFVINELIPTLQTLGLTNVGVWHTAYGDYPVRLLVFATEDPATMERAMKSDAWNEMEAKLKTFVSDYTRRIVPNEDYFQF